MNSGKKIASLLAGGALTIAAVPLAGTAPCQRSRARRAERHERSGRRCQRRVARRTRAGRPAGHPARPRRLRVEPGRHHRQRHPRQGPLSKPCLPVRGPGRRGRQPCGRSGQARRHRLHRSDRRRGERVHGLGGRFQAEGPHAQDHGLHLLRPTPPTGGPARTPTSRASGFRRWSTRRLPSKVRTPSRSPRVTAIRWRCPCSTSCSATASW